MDQCLCWLVDPEHFLIGGSKHALFSVLFGVMIALHQYLSRGFGLKPPASTTVYTQTNIQMWV
jgi:hypothetical protein